VTIQIHRDDLIPKEDGAVVAKRIKKITVTAIGTPPPLLLRPLVDEVLRVTESRRAAESEPRAGSDPYDGLSRRRTREPSRR
jgi:hypothetical protein